MKRIKINLDKHITLTWPHWFWRASTFLLLLAIAGFLGYIAVLLTVQAHRFEAAGEWVQKAME